MYREQPAVLWRICLFFFGCMFAAACLLSLFFGLVMEGMPALPGRCSRPRRRNRISVPFLWIGALLAVLKATVGEGFYRLEVAPGRPRPSGEASKMGRSWREGDATKVEYGGLSGLGCCSAFGRGLSAGLYLCVVEVLVCLYVVLYLFCALEYKHASQKKKCESVAK